jgi:hypothetical protein
VQEEKRYQCNFNLLPMLSFITYSRLAQGILLFHRYLLLYHPPVLPSLHGFFSLMSRTESIPKLYSIAQCTKFSFPTSLYLSKSDSGQESYVCFTSAMKSVLKFQNAQRLIFSPYLLARVFKLVDS